MKKILVVLLALAVIGGAFAQTFTMGSSGTATLYDQAGKSSFARDGSGYDLLTFKGADKDGKWGYSATIDNFDNAASGDFYLRDWSASYTIPQAKVILGKVRNGDFRTAVSNGYIMGVGATKRFFGGAAYGLIVESTGLGPLTVGLGLPLAETASDSVKNTFEKTNLGVKYAAEGLTFKALALLDLVANSNIVSAGVDFTGVKGLEVIALTNLTLASATSYNADVEAIVTMVDKLTGVVDFELAGGTATTYNAAVHADYAVTDAVTASAEFDYWSTAAYTAFVKGTYDFGNGLNAALKAGYANTGVIYALTAGYSISF